MVAGSVLPSARIRAFGRRALGMTVWDTPSTATVTRTGTTAQAKVAAITAAAGSTVAGTPAGAMVGAVTTDMAPYRQAKGHLERLRSVCK